MLPCLYVVVFVVFVLACGSGGGECGRLKKIVIKHLRVKPLTRSAASQQLGYSYVCVESWVGRLLLGVIVMESVVGGAA